MRIILYIIITFYILLSACNNKEEAIDKISSEDYPRVEIVNSQERIIHSVIYDHDIKLQIYLPMGYYESDTTFINDPHLIRERKESYPVLYLLDSDVYFGMASTFSRLLQWEKKLPGMIVVGISYGLSEWWDERSIDYLPFPHPDLKISVNASKHLEFYEKELIPFIESNYRADADHRILFGHSSGGIFSLYALYFKPELFQCYISASAWVGYISEFFFDVDEKYSNERNDLPAKLFITMDALESKDKRTEWEKFVNILSNRNYNKLVMKSLIIENESHLSSAPLSLIKGVQWYFSEEKKITQ